MHQAVATAKFFHFTEEGIHFWSAILEIDPKFGARHTQPTVDLAHALVFFGKLESFDNNLLTYFIDHCPLLRDCRQAIESQISLIVDIDQLTFFFLDLKVGAALVACV